MTDDDAILERRLAARWSPAPSDAHRLRVLGAVASALAREDRARRPVAARLAWAACWFLVLANAVVAASSVWPRRDHARRAVARAGHAREAFTRAFPELAPQELERTLLVLHAARRIAPATCAAVCAQSNYQHPGRVDR